MVGSSAIWTRCVQQVNSCYEAGEWLALAGEPGTGKQTLLRAVHQLHNPTRSFRNLEPPEPSDVDAWLTALDDALSTPGTMVVLEHADRLDAQTAELVADQLLELNSDDDDPTQRGRVAITVTSTDLAPNALVLAFARTIEVPPLRHHVDDLDDLVPHLLSQLIGDDRLTVSARAMAQLRRLNWPGNVTQLRRLLGEVVKRRHSGVIEIGDLPPEARTVWPSGADPDRGAGARRDRAGAPRQRPAPGRRSPSARHVARDDLPQVPSLRHLAAARPLTGHCRTVTAELQADHGLAGSVAASYATAIGRGGRSSRHVIRKQAQHCWSAAPAESVAPCSLRRYGYPSLLGRMS